MRALFPIVLSLCLLLASSGFNLAATKSGAGTLVLTGANPLTYSQDSDVPLILSSRGRNVTVRVPAGYDQITIERRAARRLQPWVTEKVEVCSPAGGEVVVRLRAPRAKRVLRVVGRKVSVVNPDSGRLVLFYGSLQSSGLSIDSGLSAVGGGSSLSGGSFSLGNTSAQLDTNTTTTTREVVESDIWKLSGDRLYVFNPYRGLQVVDVSDPADPALVGSVNVHASGDSLYLAGQNHVALLTRTVSSFTWNNAPLSAGGSLVVCDVSGAKPVAVANLALEGIPLESRLVGSALYVVTDNSGAANWSARRSLQITGYDLQNPAQPVKRNTVSVQVIADAYSYLSAVQSSDRYFVVAQQVYFRNANWRAQYRTRLHLVDISDPSGTVQLRGNVLSAGQVADKFKIHHHGDVLSAIADVWDINVPRVTRLENYSVANPNQLAKIGELELGAGESVRGTRFDGDRVYVVTFLQIDPLWLVDNSDPANPEVTGHLDVPGFSTFLQPLGDRLVTVGLLNQSVAVSLFDVSDATAPKLLTQLPVGGQWSSSEATWNEKAFTVLPDDGLIMLPIDSGWSNWFNISNGNSGGMIQLVDLNRNSLKLRGKINHGFTPRRSTVHRNAVIALGNASLLTADITDRDAPTVLADLELAWRTDYVWPLGNHLVQVGGPIGGLGSTIAISPADQPDVMLNTVELGPEPVVAADLRDGYLYVLRRRPTYSGGVYFIASVTSGTDPAATDDPLILTVHDVSSLPQIVKKAELLVPDLPAASSGKLHWPNPGTLVVSFEEQQGWRNYLDPIIIDLDLIAPRLATSEVTLSNTAVSGGGFFAPIYYGPRKMHFAAFDVRAAAAPSFIKLTSITPKQTSFFSEVFEGAGKLFVSRQNTWYFTTFTTYSTFSTGAPLSISAEPGVAPDPEVEMGRHFLHVIDYSDPASPIALPGVSSPGSLQGVTRNGTVVYTRGESYEMDGRPKSGTHALHASIYDGTKLELAGTLPSEKIFTALTLGDQVFVQTTKIDPAIEKLRAYTQLWKLGQNFEFTLQDEVPTSGYNPRAVGGVLFSQDYVYYGGAFLNAVDFSNPTDLRNVGTLTVGRYRAGLSGLIGDRENGFLLPQGEHGVIRFQLPVPAAE